MSTPATTAGDRVVARAGSSKKTLIAAIEGAMDWAPRSGQPLARGRLEYGPRVGDANVPGPPAHPTNPGVWSTRSGTWERATVQRRTGRRSLLGKPGAGLLTRRLRTAVADEGKRVR